MACLITKGKLLGCKDQRGGIKNLYMANFAEYEYTVANQVVTGLGDLEEVFKYEVKATTNALTETGTVSQDNGTFLNAQSLAVTLPKLGADLQAQIQLICAGRPQVFVEDYNGNIMLIGLTNGTMSNCTKVSGGAGGDLSGYTLTIAAEESNLSPFLNGDMIIALYGLVSDAVVS